MSHGYFTAPLSDNISETPEGFLVCHDCVVGRTGWQTYKVGDLPQEGAARLGVDTSNSQADIDLYREAEDVFDSDFLASLEGKPVCDGHPPDFVTPQNFNQFARGHMQNVRAGDEPLDNGDMPIIADLIITAEPLLGKVRNKTVRELSLGYDYSIRKDGDKVCQCDMTGNHVAVVPKGRAGGEARITDSLPSDTTVPTNNQPTEVKERTPVKNWKSFITGLGLREFAKDADPEQLAEATNAIAQHQEPPAQSDDRRADDRHADDRRADDKRQRMHDALDRAMDRLLKGDDSEVPPMGSEAAMDADLDELKGLLGDFFTEEQAEPEHAGDGELPPELEQAEDLAEEGPGEETEPDGEEEEVGDSRKVGDRARAADRADGAMKVLQAIRPFVARSNDQAIRSAFNTALGSIKRTSKASNGSYGRFAATSRARDGAGAQPARARAADSSATPDKAADRMKALQEHYNSNFRSGGK